MGIVLLTVLMDDKESAGIILALNEPEEIKKIGRHIKNFNKDLWENYCLDVVENGNMAKVFKWNLSLMDCYVSHRYYGYKTNLMIIYALRL